MRAWLSAGPVCKAVLSKESPLENQMIKVKNLGRTDVDDWEQEGLMCPVFQVAPS